MGKVEEHQVTIRFATRSLREIEVEQRWWLSHRDKNPGLFEFELAAALAQIKAAPALGIRYGSHRGRDVRYVIMLKTGYGVFYRIDGESLVRVMSVWPGRRKSGPRFA